MIACNIDFLQSGIGQDWIGWMNGSPVGVKLEDLTHGAAGDNILLRQDN